MTYEVTRDTLVLTWELEIQFCFDSQKQSEMRRRRHILRVLKKFRTRIAQMSKPQGRNTVTSTSTSKTDVTPSTSTKETNTKEQEINNSPNCTLERYMQGEKGELLLDNGYGYGYSSDLNNWPYLSLLPSEFASQIHMIMLLHENAVLIVTKDKMVYALGNWNVMYDIDDDFHYQPVKVEELCGKNIYCFYNTGVMLALTEEGEVYAWGRNEGKLGLVEHEEQILTPTKVPRLNEEHITEMAIADDHVIALTKDGKVYNWGDLEYEDLFGSQEDLPWQVEFDSDSGKIIHVSCGLKFNMALSKNGNVYSWGKNDRGSLGLHDCGKRTVRTHPSVITSLRDLVIVKVVCGLRHTLALTDTGGLYVWGNNKFGQLGYETKDNYNTIPTKLNVPEMGKIVDIFARKDLSVAINEKKHVYIWGSFYDKIVWVPTLTRLSNMYNIVKYEIPYIIHKPQIHHNEDKSELQELIFNDPLTSDITIEIDGNVIYAHKIILIRSQHFVNLSPYKMWKENRIIMHDKYSYNVYKAFLKYIYTGMVDIPSEEALELMKLADAYNETNLKNICVKAIQKGINLHNVDFIFKEANGYNLKELKEYCFEFLFTEVVNKMRMFKT